MEFLVFLVALVRSFLDAFVVWKLWQWFIEPLGVPSISYAHAYGLDLFLGYIVFAVVVIPDEAPTPEKRIYQIFAKGLGVLFTFGVAYIAHLFI